MDYVCSGHHRRDEVLWGFGPEYWPSFVELYGCVYLCFLPGFVGDRYIWSSGRHRYRCSINGCLWIGTWSGRNELHLGISGSDRDRDRTAVYPQCGHNNCSTLVPDEGTCDRERDRFSGNLSRYPRWLGPDALSDTKLPNQRDAHDLWNCVCGRDDNLLLICPGTPAFTSMPA